MFRENKKGSHINNADISARSTFSLLYVLTRKVILDLKYKLSKPTFYRKKN
jgi:hypothetical protein